MAEHEIIAGLDLGSTKVCAIVAEQTEEGLDIIGIGSVPSKGLKKGVVVNIESTVQAIRAAVEQAETMAGVEINAVYAGIAGSHVRGMNQDGVAAIANREVALEDVTRVLEQAKAVPLPGDRQVIHVLPQEYIVDDQDGIKEPIGMAGVRLEARVHMVTAASTSVANVTKCAERCGLFVEEVVLQPLASAHAVLSGDEREIGGVLIDVGGGTSDIIIYVDGAVVHTSSIPIGGINLTSDIATGLRTPMAEAERIKIKYGCAATRMVDDDETIEVPSVGGRPSRSRRVSSRHCRDRLHGHVGFWSDRHRWDDAPGWIARACRGSPRPARTSWSAHGYRWIDRRREEPFLRNRRRIGEARSGPTSRGLSRKIGAWFREVF
jgi:cell division protein FtsA